MGATPGDDALSEVLSICRSERAVTARFALTAPWGLRSLGTPGALIRLARGAPYWMRVPGHAAVRVEPGDLVMVPPGIAHDIDSGDGVAPAPFSDLIDRHAVGPRGENPLVFSHGSGAGGGALTDLFSAQVWFSAYCRRTVFSILPPFILVRSADLTLAGALATTMQSLIEETLARRAGWRLSAARMGDLLLVQILREHLVAEPAIRAGWLRGLTDVTIARAIMQIHRVPQQRWTLAGLSREAGLSRTAFAARFHQLVGTSPIAYLTQHRMALAAQALEGGALRVGQIAQSVGYSSDKVFARAFARWSGLAPGAYARGRRPPREGDAREPGDRLA